LKSKVCNICGGIGWHGKTVTSNSLIQTRFAEVCWLCSGTGNKPEKFLKRILKYFLHYLLLIVLVVAILGALVCKIFLR
jgi:hypothetical protein